jgi:hypothetical protein
LRFPRAAHSGPIWNPVCNVQIGGSSARGTWGTDGSLYFAPFSTSGIWQVAASGGSPREITRPDRTQGEVSHWFDELKRAIRTAK